MYRPNKARKKDCSIQVTRKSGFSIVFVKTIVEMFIKPIIDTIISDPDKDPISSFTSNGHNKTIGKKIDNNEPEMRPKKAYCDYCDKMFYNTKGLKIHMGKVHKEEKVPNDPPISNKKRQWEECDKSETMCDDCGQEFTAKEALRWHIEKCQKRMKMFHDTRKLTPANKKAMSKTELLVGSQIPTNKPKLSEDKHINVDTQDIRLHACNKCEFKSKVLYELKQHKRDAHRDLSASVTPPPKKTKEILPEIEPEIERVLKEMENLNVEDIKKVYEEIREEDKIPERLNEYMLRRVGGGGQCGVKCVSLHTTGKEDQATEIRTNVNEHIVEHWEDIYKDAYNFPYTERVGSGNITFNNDDEFIDFLLHEPARASTLWMTHVDMQAVSTMLNININILTTGIPPTRNFMCPSQVRILKQRVI